jgi:2-polyprenyl-3-methyl-5-hydroxy-6-metoxy-1,4-benzoquinol methylase
LSPTAFRAREGRDGSYVELDLRPHGGHAKLVAAVGSGRRVLDIGCSTGYLARILSERENRVVGIEVDPRAAAQARQWCEEVFVGDAETVELPMKLGVFDVILCADVVEHLRDPVRFLKGKRPLLRDGGVLVLSTPNIANWSIRASLLAGSFRYTERVILDRTHTHFFTRRTLIEGLETAGYRVETLDFTVPVPLVGMPSVEAVAEAVGRLRPSLFAYQFIATAKAP